MSRDRHRNDSVGDEIGDPPLARALLHHTRAGWLWLPVRVSLGYEWLRTGLEQLRDPNWMDGTAVLAFWWDAVDAPGSADNASAAYGWYRALLLLVIDARAEELVARLVAFGEVAAGLGLVLGAFTGIAAFAGAFMNMSFMLAGTTASNPLMFVGAIGLMLGWRVAGYYGLDRWILPSVGTPWPQPAPRPPG